MSIEASNRVPSAAANGKNGHSLISNGKFRQLYELALRLEMGANGDGSRWLHGREAIVAGVVADLLAEDVIVADYPASIEQMLRGTVRLRVAGRDFKERVIDAMADALADRLRKTGRVTVIFSELAQPESALKEARAIAGAAGLPVLFVESRQQTAARPARGVRKGKGLPAATAFPMIPVDTRDVIAIYRAAHESIERARDGSGPTHIVAIPWQVAKGRGRSRAATAEPLQHLEEWLTARGLPAQEWRKEIQRQFEAQDGGRTFGAENADGANREDAEKRAIA